MLKPRVRQPVDLYLNIDIATARYSETCPYQLSRTFVEVSPEEW